MASNVSVLRRAGNGEDPDVAPESFGEAARRGLRRGKGELMQHTGTDVLLDREAEIAVLDGLVAQAADGRGRLALIEGPPGIGKTRLVQAARDRAGAAGMVVLVARASELDRDFP